MLVDRKEGETEESKVNEKLSSDRSLRQGVRKFTF